MSQQHRSASSDVPGPWSGRCAESLICPVCAGRLIAAGSQLRCGRGHAFDIAREGYVNLMIDGHGRSKIRGDTREMLHARRRFLERGYFEPVADAVAAEIEAYVAARSGAETLGGLTVVDVGCGEGYYTGRLMRSDTRRASSVDDRFIGIDVSKEAVRMAARRYPCGCFIANDVRTRITMAGASADVMLDIFAPRNPPELARVLRPSGLLLVVIPRAAHLRELRARWPLIGIEPDKAERTIARLRGLFRPVGRRAMEYAIDLPGGDLADLIAMTPSRHHLDGPVLSEAASVDRLRVTVGVDILRFLPDVSGGGEQQTPRDRHCSGSCNFRRDM